uniref:Transmembrane protein n=1 Tax=Glycine max TaxID=3847 RepID=A0A0R0ISY9_SOYBN
MQVRVIGDRGDVCAIISWNRVWEVEKVKEIWYCWCGIRKLVMILKWGVAIIVLILLRVFCNDFHCYCSVSICICSIFSTGIRVGKGGVVVVVVVVGLCGRHNSL